MASLSDIVKEIQSTNDLLMDNVAAQKRVFGLMDDASRQDQKDRMDAIAASKKGSVTATKSGGGMTRGFGAGFKKGIGGGLLGGIFKALFGAGSGLLGIITGAIGTALGMLIIPAAAIILLTKFGEDLIVALIKKLDPNNVVIDDADRKYFANGIVKALIVGIGVAMFNKTLGLAAFLGLLITTSFMTGMTEEKRKEFKKDILDGAGEKLGITFSKKNMMDIGGILASLASFAMIKSLFRTAIFGSAATAGAGVGGALAAARNSKVFGFIRAGFMGRFGVASILFAIGDTLGEAIAELTGSPELGKSFTGLVYGVGLAAALGLSATGFFTLAIIGLAVGAMSFIAKFLRDRRSALITDTEAAMNKHLAATENMTDAEKAAYFANSSEIEQSEMINAQRTMEGINARNDSKKAREIEKLLMLSPEARSVIGANLEGAKINETFDLSAMRKSEGGEGYKTEKVIAKLMKFIQSVDTQFGGLLPASGLLSSAIGTAFNMGGSGNNLDFLLQENQKVLQERINIMKQNEEADKLSSAAPIIIDQSKNDGSVQLSSVSLSNNGLHTADTDLMAYT